MTDLRLRELQRKATQGDVDASLVWIRRSIELGHIRDPRKGPRPGDVVRQPRHGQGDLVRWDHRIVAPCLHTGSTIVTPCSHGWDHVHWVRTVESFKVLQHWALARVPRGMTLLKGWRAWARNGEVLHVCGEIGGGDCGEHKGVTHG